MYGSVSDSSYLLNELNTARQQATTDTTFGDSASRRADVISQRLAQLGVGIPGRAIGGSTGMAFRAHPGEVVFLGNKAQVLSSGEAKDVLAKGAGSSDRMEQSYRLGTQALHGAIRELVEETKMNRQELKRMSKQLQRVTEKVGA